MYNNVGYVMNKIGKVKTSMKRKDRISVQIDQIEKLKCVQRSGYLSDIATLRERLEDKTFRLAVVGEFSSGKSTFINAIIGKDVLKHAATETTATVTYIINVSTDDTRINTCDIEYSDGIKKNIPNLEELKKYTTVNSEINVAEEIRAVSIYVNFLNVSYPIIIVDTPGLNGIADKHRDITINEIKKAHACIYLLSSNGVKLTDQEFINILLNYQKRFIFIQNFIDLLRISEGETLQSKLKKDHENLIVCFGEDSNEIKFDLYGISAVKALAAKDIRKKKVFEDDSEIIGNRKNLLNESNFLSFEKGLYEIIESGECFKVIEDSVIYTLSRIIERVKERLDEECILNEQLRAKDDKQRGIEKAYKIIERINSQKKDQKKRLENFLISRDSENRHSLQEYIKRSLDELYEFVASDFDKKAKSYEELITFANFFGYEPAKYYGKYVSNYINSEMVPDIDDRIQDNLSHLYDEAILKVSNFVTNVSKNKENIKIEINSAIVGFSEKEIQPDFEKYKVEAESKRFRMNTIEANVKAKNAQKINIEKDMKNEIQRADNDSQQFEQDIQRLGIDPGVKKKSIQKTRTVSRTGFFVEFRDWLFGEKIETYWSTENDYSEQNAWKKIKATLEERNRRIQEIHKNRMTDLEQKKKKLQDEIGISTSAIERLKSDIEYLEKRAAREKEIYEKTLKANKQEFCDNERRKLKAEFENALLDISRESSAISCLKKHIDEVDKKNLPTVQKKVIKYYEDAVKARLDNLHELIEGNEIELKNKYEISKKEMKVLMDALSILN